MRTRLRPGENLAAVVRRHVIVLGGPFALMLFLSGGLIGAFFVKRPYALPAAAILLGLAAAWGLWRWLDWRAGPGGGAPQRGLRGAGGPSGRRAGDPPHKIHGINTPPSLWGRKLR